MLREAMFQFGNGFKNVILEKHPQRKEDRGIHC
jgi:hypothetical protein